MSGRAWLIVAALAVLLPAGCLGMPILGMIAVSSTTPPVDIPQGVPGIRPMILQAYVRGAHAVREHRPKCTGMRWQILAAVGKIESNHVAGRRITGRGDVTPPFYGPRLDGSGVGGNLTPHHDSDNGKWDGDTKYDRAVGLMQFIPAAWRDFGTDGNADRIAHPGNIYDATISNAIYLCGRGRRDLNDRRQLYQAIYSYNHAHWYVRKVLHWLRTYDRITEAVDAPIVGGTARGRAIVAAAKRWLGTPYSWGGGGTSGPSRGFCCSPSGGNGARTYGFDCSGLTQYAYARVGIPIPRVAADQYHLPEQRRDAIRIPAGHGVHALAPGDLVFFGAGIHHVGIYTGRGTYIHAPATGDVVKISRLRDRPDFAGAVRVT